MNLDSIIFELSLIVVGAAALGTLFLYARQPIVIAYVAIGFAAGPNGLGVIRSTDHIEEIAHFGVILLLFLIGLNLQPLKFLKLFRKTALLTFGTSVVFGSLSLLFALLFLRYDLHSAALFGAAMMFSSTVVGLKLVPTTTLHHKRTGEIMTSILLLQDVLAILVILFVTGEKSDHILMTFAVLAGRFALLCLLSFIGVRYVMVPLLRRFDVVQEYAFVATLGWCMLWAEAAHALGLSYEMGAFVAGLSIASCQIALVIAEHLKPLREFFLILFFFAIGAELDFRIAPRLLFLALVFGVILVPLKAGVFRFAFRKSGESLGLSRELSVRLAQSSEFSLLVVFAALSVGVLSAERAMVVQLATITTFILSTYWVVLKYPTPISTRTTLRQD
ncbi:MAG TPA: cation:proton antiporter [Candidatus Hydrogenedentes bacterium]|nr:cation:proton antiporter [Candidatus Hydrogenedentota bacterium]